MDPPPLPLAPADAEQTELDDRSRCEESKEVACFLLTKKLFEQLVSTELEMLGYVSEDC